MFYYDKTPKQMLVDLINEANPDLPFEINTTDYEFLDPVSITATPEGHNTQIRLVAKPDAPYFGNIVLTYRRLSLSNLFNGVVPIVYKWVPYSGGTTATNVYPINLYDLLPLYSKKYGLLLDESQINDRSLTNYNGTVEGSRFNITAKSTSYIYTGSVSAEWKRGEQSLEDAITNDEIDGITYPGGNDFTDLDTRKLYLTPITFDVDFSLDYFNSPNKTYWAQWSNLRLGVNNSSYERMFQAWWGAFARVYEEHTGVVPTYLSESNDYNRYLNNEHDFTGFVVKHYALYNNSVPEANSDYYNRVTVIECPADCPWAVGNIYLHYNI